MRKCVSLAKKKIRWPPKEKNANDNNNYNNEKPPLRNSTFRRTCEEN